MSQFVTALAARAVQDPVAANVIHKLLAHTQLDAHAVAISKTVQEFEQLINSVHINKYIFI